jgi:Glyoxalase-like domain
MATLRQIVVDCRHPASLARFWAAALDGFEMLPYDQVEISRLEMLGLTPETDTCVIVVGPSIEFGFQQVDVVEVHKKPMHVDISAPDHDVEAERLVHLGATVKERFGEHTWMRDPEGNDFCVTNERERGA